jgi:hypothetical protein
MLSEARCTNDRRSAAKAVMLELSLADIYAAQGLCWNDAAAKSATQQIPSRLQLIQRARTK